MYPKGEFFDCSFGIVGESHVVYTVFDPTASEAKKKEK